MAWMYILKCCDGTFYIGSTTSLESRLFQHQQGSGAIYTSKRPPVELVYYEEYRNVAEAFAREKQVQKTTRSIKEEIYKQEITPHSWKNNMVEVSIRPPKPRATRPPYQ